MEILTEDSAKRCLSPRCQAPSSSKPEDRHELAGHRSTLVAFLCLLVAAASAPPEARGQTTQLFVNGTEVTSFEAEGGEGSYRGAWTDSAAKACSNMTCGIGLSYVEYTFPNNLHCPEDSCIGGTASNPGNASYYEIDIGVKGTVSPPAQCPSAALPAASSARGANGLTYCYDDRLYPGESCCDCTEDGRGPSVTTRYESCHFDTKAEASSLVNTDGTVYFDYIDEMGTPVSTDHSVSYTNSVTFPEEVFAAIPVLAGTWGGLKDRADLEEWKLSLPQGDMTSPSSDVTFKGEVYVGAQENLDSSAKLGTTLIGLPVMNNGPDGSRIPTVVVVRFIRGGFSDECPAPGPPANPNCIALKGEYNDKTHEGYSCSEGPSVVVSNLTTFEREVTVSFGDIANDQQISGRSTAFIQSARLAFDGYHHLSVIKLDTGSKNIGERSCPPSGNCSQQISFSPVYFRLGYSTDTSHHDEADCSYMDVALLILFDYQLQGEVLKAGNQTLYETIH